MMLRVHCARSILHGAMTAHGFAARALRLRVERLVHHRAQADAIRSVVSGARH